jgi:hypothetical protein
MLIHGHPLSLDLPQDLGLQERFWYWRGASGRKYIHSVYEPELCPPLPGAIFVAVRRTGSLRTAISCGRFAPFWDGAMANQVLGQLSSSGVNEIHVHLLAREPEDATRVLADLDSALRDAAGGDFPGFHEEAGTLAVSARLEAASEKFESAVVDAH